MAKNLAILVMGDIGIMKFVFFGPIKVRAWSVEGETSRMKIKTQKPRWAMLVFLLYKMVCN